MKFLFLFLLSFYISIDTNSQSIDSAYIRCSYKLTFLYDSTKPSFKKTDIFDLLIGKQKASFFSYTKFVNDSVVNVNIANGTMQEFLKNPQMQTKYKSPGVYSNSKLYINFPENKTTITEQIGGSKFIYEEGNENIVWEITSDTMSIIGYQCQMATMDFRGRSYIAWFAQEIPISMGPYKFRGLPGLILRIADTKNNYVYECTRVENLLTKTPIIIESKDCLKTTRTEFRKLFKNSFENPWETMTSNGTVSITGPNVEKLKIALEKGIPYNPIELE